MAPIIGITRSAPRSYTQTIRAAVSQSAYFYAIRKAGGIPIALEYSSEGMAVESKIHGYAGILFSGGGDINPRIYGKQSNDHIHDLDDSRDLLEFALFRLVIDKDIPFLGICRGMQLVNVALGGGLYRHLPGEHPSNVLHDWLPSRHYLAHTVRLAPDCRLCSMGYPNSFGVNSLHHQGIHEPGKGLKAIANAEDGLIEAIELTGHRFGLAVQWHPEWLVEQQTARALFEAFIKACAS